ncbi:unnamed protein product [Urochloa decumbens]|uniref:Acidic protein n=1 Tax=Urochloa decumbens TaxID=240449 RepID=A0ABC9EVY4_9POAL
MGRSPKLLYSRVEKEILPAMGSQGLNGVLIMCVLLLGLVLEQAQVEGMSCCKNIAARSCYNTCSSAGTPLNTCANRCSCIFLGGIICPSDYPIKLNFLPKFESDKVEYCSIRCRSVMCDSMDNVGGAEDVKINAERCGYACDNFCNGFAINAPVVA